MTGRTTAKPAWRMLEADAGDTRRASRNQQCLLESKLGKRRSTQFDEPDAAMHARAERTSVTMSQSVISTMRRSAAKAVPRKFVIRRRDKKVIVKEAIETVSSSGSRITEDAPSDPSIKSRSSVRDCRDHEIRDELKSEAEINPLSEFTVVAGEVALIWAISFSRSHQQRRSSMPPNAVVRVTRPMALECCRGGTSGRFNEAMAEAPDSESKATSRCRRQPCSQ